MDHPNAYYFVSAAYLLNTVWFALFFAGAIGKGPYAKPIEWPRFLQSLNSKLVKGSIGLIGFFVGIYATLWAISMIKA